MEPQPLIEFRDVVKTLGKKRVLNGVSLKIYRGQITAIIGKSGSGKSVLLKHIIGLYEPDAGDILYEGKPRAAMSQAQRRALKAKFSYVFQDTALFDFLTVFDNIALPLVERHAYPQSEIRRRVTSKLRQLDLQEVEGKYPSQLSGGMKKRVALARALVTDPEIVLFDEPTTGLDPIRKNAVHSMIQDYQRRFGFTGVVVTHEIPDIFFISQWVIMIDEGAILAQGSPEAIQKSPDPRVKGFLEGLESPQDALTGIATHSFGHKRLEQEMDRLQRHKIPFSIVLLAVDNLAEVDQIAGHVAGQNAFKAFANYVSQNAYVTDTCFRYDLNKILVILPDTNRHQARLFCRKLARGMQNNALFETVDVHGGLCFSISAGIAEAHPDSPMETLVGEADRLRNIFYECTL